MYIKTIIFGLLYFGLAVPLFAQSTEAFYEAAMKAYKRRDYTTAAAQFDEVIKGKGYSASTSALYDGACIYALQGNTARALDILTFLANKRYWSNLAHLRSDKDLESLRTLPAWETLVSQVMLNQAAQPARTRARVQQQIRKAKAILAADNGRLWGADIWSDNIVFLEPDNTVYAVKPLPGTVRTPEGLYSCRMEPKVFSQTNSVQTYEGESYATVLTSYLNDSSATLIHELFHVLHGRHKKLLGDPVNYLDNADAREWLRLEFQALRQALQSASAGNKTTVVQYLNDALVFRRQRHEKYADALDGELQIETLEGLANYTGLALSAYPDLYARAIKEINSREEASTYTRPFPYATGPAYGLLFDYLALPWRTGLDHVYDFLQIYETLYNKRPVYADARTIKQARKRNNYDAIHRQELARKQEHDRQVAFYTDMLVTRPVLRVAIGSDQYSRSFDMNGTLVLGTWGMVYSGITGTDGSGNNFGNFSILPDKAALGQTGILGAFDGRHFTFPLPFRTEGNRLIGDWYVIELNAGWQVQQVNEKGDMEIVKR